MFSDKLLEWYDHNARDLPWRVPPNETQLQPNPYYVWLSEVMLQQTTVAAVKAYFEKFIKLWPTVFDLAAASQDEVTGQWAGLGYYARARNLHKCAQVVARDYNGVFPQTESDLLKLPGIGAYTAAAIAAIAFNKRAVVVDGNVERVISRLYAVQERLPQAKPILRKYADDLTPDTRCGDYAQAMMDLGATLCTPRSPACLMCPVHSFCEAYRAGQSEKYPRKAPKQAKPVRYGVAYVIQRQRDGAFLLERRPEKGLLGGMLGFPGTPWTEQEVAPNPPFPSDWEEYKDRVIHVFTHFQLNLRVFRTIIDAEDPPSPYEVLNFYSHATVKSLPTVMKKVLK
jgi:A/G-specific adenine glycosylase